MGQSLWGPVQGFLPGACRKFHVASFLTTETSTVTGSAELCGPSGRAAAPESEPDAELFLVLGPTRSGRAHLSLRT